MSGDTQLELDIAASEGSGAALSRLVADYRPVPGLHDELIDASGRIRPHWLGVLEELARLGAEGSQRSFAVADRQLSDNGVVYRVYDEQAGHERPWPLSHVPLVLTAEDWATLSAGVTQRAALMEAVLQDLYGPARLVADGILPAAAVAGNPEFLRPLAGVTPKGGRHLIIYAADVSRGPDGRWWVLADRTQAPSGLGYAVENRIAISAALPELFEDMGVARLASFVQTVRSNLALAAGREDPHIAVLTPGPANETYFEHAYLARVLGFPLVEGADLAVHEDMLHLRDIEGARRIDVLLRRVDSAYMDPLELEAGSRLGVPGMLQAVRAGEVAIANALGSGLVEAPLFRAFLDSICRHLRSEPLLLPSLATWWLGDPAVRRTVTANLEGYNLAPAFGRSLPGIIDNMGVTPSSMTAEARARLLAAIERRGADFVGQEEVRLSTMPSMVDGQLAPRPFALRIFAIAGPDGWTVMPGGLCRISKRPDARSLSMQRGGRSADAWVLGQTPIATDLILPPAHEIEPRRETSGLPARAADNLFWLGRYLERVDTTLRVIRNLVGRSGDEDPDKGSDPSAKRLADLLVAWGAVPFEPRRPSQAAILALSSDLQGAIPALVSSVRRTALSVRDRLSPDAWRILADLASALASAEPPRSAREVHARAEEAMRLVAAFGGLTHESMYRRAGWRFLDLGGRIERAIAVARCTRRLACGGVDVRDLERLLELTDTRVVYRSRYLAGLAARPVIDLVMLDEANPRSVVFQLERVLEHLILIAGRREGAGHDPVEKPALRLLADMETADAASFSIERIEEVEAGLMAVSDAVTRRWFVETGAMEHVPAIGEDVA